MTRVVEDREVKDIEELLDQVEVKFLTNRSKYDSNRIVLPPSEAKKCPCTIKTETNWNEIDELLQDFKLEDQNSVGATSFGKTSHWKERYEQQGAKVKETKRNDAKCIPPYLAGSYEPMGYSAPGFEKSCNRLGCLQCDFNVESWDNFCWDPSTDYLFLRTNMPAFDKVAQKLVKRKGSRAYACQCQHVTISKLTHVGALPQLKWICRRHSS